MKKNERRTNMPINIIIYSLLVGIGTMTVVAGLGFVAMKVQSFFPDR